MLCFSDVFTLIYVLCLNYLNHHSAFKIYIYYCHFNVDNAHYFINRVDQLQKCSLGGPTDVGLSRTIGPEQYHIVQLCIETIFSVVWELGGRDPSPSKHLFGFLLSTSPSCTKMIHKLSTIYWFLWSNKNIKPELWKFITPKFFTR